MGAGPHVGQPSGAGPSGAYALVVAAASVVMLLAACQPQASGVQTTASTCGPAAPDNSITQAVFNGVNADRAANGLGPLAWNAQLACLAQDHSNYMATSGDFSHRDLAATIRQPDYANYVARRENILVGPNTMTGAAMETAWMNSPGHRANITVAELRLDRHCRRLGSDDASGPQNFGRNR